MSVKVNYRSRTAVDFELPESVEAIDGRDDDGDFHFLLMQGMTLQLCHAELSGHNSYQGERLTMFDGTWNERHNVALDLHPEVVVPLIKEMLRLHRKLSAHEVADLVQYIQELGDEE